MFVTLSGIVILVNLVLPSKALSPIAVTLLGIVVFLHPTISVFEFFSIIALQLFLLSYTLLPSFTFIFIKLSHPINMPPLICATLAEISTLVKSGQATNE